MSRPRFFGRFYGDRPSDSDLPHKRSESEGPSVFAQVGYAARIDVYIRVLSANPVAVNKGLGRFWAVRQFASVRARCGTGVPDAPPASLGSSRVLAGEWLENT